MRTMMKETSALAIAYTLGWIEYGLFVEFQKLDSNSTRNNPKNFEN
jgi:hypothetical protein